MQIAVSPKSAPIDPSTSSPSTRFSARVLYSYIPVNEDELAIQESEIVEVIRLVEDGWFEGTFMGKQGVFPSNYVERLLAPESTQHPPSLKLSSEAIPAGKLPSYSDNSVDSDSDKARKSKKVICFCFVRFRTIINYGVSLFVPHFFLGLCSPLFSTPN